MKIYLDNTPLQEASDKWFRKIKEIVSPEKFNEETPVVESLHRITAVAVSAERSSPFYHSSAMDGYAVNHGDTFGASETDPVLLKIPESAEYLNTGDPVPDDFNAVIKIEDINIVERGSNKYIEVISPVTPWQNVRVIGEDIVASELILPENHCIRPVDIAGMLAGGIDTILVKKRPVVAVIPTGDEIVEKASGLSRGEIVDTNSWMLMGALSENGAVPERYSIVPDKIDIIKETVGNAVSKSDLVLVIAGSSAGTEDFTADVIRDIGEVVIHGVNIKPGKPVILGIVENKPVIGVPGYPVSAYLAFSLFIKPVLNIYYGTGLSEVEMISAKLSRQVSSRLGIEEFVRMKLGNVSGDIIATPVSRGAGLIMSLIRADGLMRIPAMSEGFGMGAEVQIELIKDEKEIANTLVCIGSHDNALDIIANFLKKRYPVFSLSSAHVGSMGGIMAVKNREAHIAGTHLLDEQTGEYNIPFIRKFIGDRKLKLINLVYRDQGFLLLKGNPKGIKDIRDLKRDDIVFINRQPGSGTRLLTDKCLKDSEISPDAVQGYDRMEFTHMSVASAVKSGVADTGIGIYAASVALGLDFLPVAKERYDIIIPDEYWDDEKLKAFLHIIKDDEEFRTTVKSLGGYDVTDMGRVVYEQ